MKKKIMLAMSGCLIASLMGGCGKTAGSSTVEASKKAVESQISDTESAEEVSETSAETETDVNTAVQNGETERETGEPVYQAEKICGDYQAYGFWTQTLQDYKVNYEETLFDLTPLTEEEEAAIEAYASRLTSELEEQTDDVMEELCKRKSTQTIQLHFSPDGSGLYTVNDYIGRGQFELKTYTFVWTPDKTNPKDFLWQINTESEQKNEKMNAIYSYGDGIYHVVVEKAESDRVKDGLMEGGFFVKEMEAVEEKENVASDLQETMETETADQEQVEQVNAHGVNTAYIGNWESSIAAYNYGTVETDEIHGSMILREDGTGTFFTQENSSFEITWGVIEGSDCYIAAADQNKAFSGTIIDGEASVMEDKQYLYTMHQVSNVPDQS